MHSGTLKGKEKAIGVSLVNLAVPASSAVLDLLLEDYFRLPKQ